MTCCPDIFSCQSLCCIVVKYDKEQALHLVYLMSLTGPCSTCIASMMYSCRVIIRSACYDCSTLCQYACGRVQIAQGETEPRGMMIALKAAHKPMFNHQLVANVSPSLMAWSLISKIIFEPRARNPLSASKHGHNFDDCHVCDCTDLDSREISGQLHSNSAQVRFKVPDADDDCSYSGHHDNRGHGVCQHNGDNRSHAGQGSPRPRSSGQQHPYIEASKHERGTVTTCLCMPVLGMSLNSLWPPLS